VLWLENVWQRCSHQNIGFEDQQLLPLPHAHKDQALLKRFRPPVGRGRCPQKVRSVPCASLGVADSGSENSSSFWPLSETMDGQCAFQKYHRAKNCDWSPTVTASRAFTTTKCGAALHSSNPFGHRNQNIGLNHEMAKPPSTGRTTPWI
jgi:hypothetical protein